MPTSEKTRRRPRRLGIALTTLEELRSSISPSTAPMRSTTARLIKGGGGALLREKIVAAASGRMIVIADASKQVETLGAFPLPVEIVPFGARATTGASSRRCGRTDLPAANVEVAACAAGASRSSPTSGNFIVRLRASIASNEPGELARPRCRTFPAWSGHGLFIGIATHRRIIGTPARRAHAPALIRWPAYDYDLFVIGAGSGGVRAGAHGRRARRQGGDRRGVPRRRHLRHPRLRAEEAARLCQPLRAKSSRMRAGFGWTQPGRRLRLADADRQQGHRRSTASARRLSSAISRRPAPRSSTTRAELVGSQHACVLAGRPHGSRPAPS